MKETPFSTIFDLRASHTQLLVLQRQGSPFPEMAPRVSSFILRAREAGAFLDVEEHRLAAQGLIDYWLTKLDPALVPFDDSTLVDFDESQAPELDDDQCPYVGLEAFREKDTRNFFGRAETLDRALQVIRDARFLSIIGPSGSGKSSIVLGGLLPLLKQGDKSRDWRYATPFTPGSEPSGNLVKAMASVLGDGGPFVIVVDQFEELFTLTDDVAARNAFAQELLAVHANGGVVIVTIREDYIPRLGAHPELQNLVRKGDLRATPLSAAELREAIEKPAERINLKFESGLVDALVADVVGEPAALPLLQFTLWRLWTKRRRNRLTLDIYREVGGGRSALARAADEVFTDLKIVQNQDTMRRILLRMVRPGASSETTSARVRVSALLAIGDDPTRIQAVLDKLLAARLVRRTAGETPDDDQIEVAHEALIRNWPKLVEWVEEKKATLTELRRFETLADEWERFGRQFGFLDAEQVKEADEWMHTDEAKEIGVKESLPALVEASRALIEKARSRERMAKGLVALLTIFVIAFLVLAWLNARDAAESARDAAKNAAAAARSAGFERDAAQAKLKLQQEDREDAETQRAHVRELQREKQIAEEERTKAELAAQDAKKKLEAYLAERRKFEEEQAKVVELAKKISNVYTGVEQSVDTRDCNVCLVPNPLGGDCRQWGNDPACEAAKAAQKTLYEAEQALRRQEMVQGASLRGRVRPVKPGLSIGGIGTDDSGSGTLCCVVRSRSTGERYVLTLGFVVGGKEGVPVVQPGVADGGTSADRIGTVARVAMSDYRGGALIRLDKGIEADAAIPKLGRINDVAKRIGPGDRVMAVGRGSGLQTGEVSLVEVNGQLVTTLPPGEGNAGAAVVNAKNEIVGVVWGSDRQSTFVMPIGPILEELGVELVK